MKMNDYIQYIRKAINNKNYEKYLDIYKKYKNYLEEMIKNNEEDIVLNCKLAAVNFMINDDLNEIIDSLEKFLKDDIKCIIDRDKARIYANLAFFYYENCEYEKNIDYLKKAIDLKIKSPVIYNELACIMFEKEEFAKALDLFEKAFFISKELKYEFNYALALLKNEEIEKSQEIFEKLAYKYPENRQVLYTLGISYAYNNNLSKTFEIAEKLSEIKEHEYAVNYDDIAYKEVADLYYLCGEYERHNYMIDNAKIKYDKDMFFATYSYCLKIQNKFEEMNKNLKYILKEIDDLKKSIKAEPLEEFQNIYTKQDKINDLIECEKKKGDIIRIYDEILNQNYKPVPSLYLVCMKDCYLLDCPEHENDIFD